MQFPSLFRSKCLFTRTVLRRIRREPSIAARTVHHSVVCAQYYPCNHPFVERGNNDNMYTNASFGTTIALQLNVEGERHAQDRVDPPSFLLTEVSSSSSSRAMLRRQLREMLKAVFFYHESNPHIGIITNTQVLLYDEHALVGPVKGSWAKILAKEADLVDCLIQHLSTLQKEYNLWTLANLIESISRKENVSLCKFQSSVIDNVVQFRRPHLTSEELIVLEVLAQYASYPYEIINW